MPKASTYPARALTNILGVDASGNVGLMTSLFLTGQFGITASGITTTAFDGSSWMTFAAPNTKAFMLSTFDQAGALTRTWDQGSGRMDLYGNGAAGAAMVVAYSGAPVDGNNLGHYAWRGKDSNNSSYNTPAYIIAYLSTVSAAALNSQMQLGVMRNVVAGAGNAQPNWFVVIDGQQNTMTLPTAMSLTMTGNANFAAASGPTSVYTNTANSRVANVGIIDNFNGGISVTGGGSAQLLASGNLGITTNGTVNKLVLPTQTYADSRVSKTSNYTVLAADGGTEFDNLAASGEVDFTLPVPTKGLKLGFSVVAAQILKLIATSGVTINVGSTVSASAGNVASSQLGASIEVEAYDTTHWVAKRVTGSGGSTGAGGWTVT